MNLNRHNDAVTHTNVHVVGNITLTTRNITTDQHTYTHTLK